MIFTFIKFWYEIDTLKFMMKRQENFFLQTFTL